MKQEKVIFSHNSMSYRPLVNWWLRPFRFIFRCQDRKISEQLEDLLVFNENEAGFDIRIRFRYNEFNPVLCHGLAVFKGDFNQLLEWLDKQAIGRKIYVRIINETHLLMRKKVLLYNRIMMDNILSSVVETYKNIIFVNPMDKLSWRNICPQEINIRTIPIDEYHASVKETGFKSIMLKKWAKENNTISNDSIFQMYDYVEYLKK